MSMSPGLATTLGSALDILGHQQTGLSISLPVDPSACGAAQWFKG